MTSRKRGTSWQVDMMVDGKRVRKDFADAAGAEQYEAAVRLSALTGKPVPTADRTAGEYTLEQGYKRTLATRWKGTRGEHTAVMNARAALTYFGVKKPVAEIDATAIKDYVIALEESGNSNGTINRKLAALSAILTDAKEEGKIEKAPKMKRKKEGGGRTAFLTPELEAAILSNLHAWGYHDAADLVVILVDTGVRLGEFYRFAKQDKHDHRAAHGAISHSVSVWENKADLPRTIPLTKRAALAFDRVVPCQIEEHTLRAIWDRLRVVLKKEDDKQFVVHILRHTFGSRLVQRGIGILTVQKLMGHRTIEQTMRYAHLAPQNFHEAVAVLEQPQAPAALQVVAGHGAIDRVDIAEVDRRLRGVEK